MKAYLVSTGSYYDYGVDSVWSTREGAEARLQVMADDSRVSRSISDRCYDQPVREVYSQGDYDDARIEDVDFDDPAQLVSILDVARLKTVLDMERLPGEANFAYQIRMRLAYGLK